MLQLDNQDNIVGIWPPTWTTIINADNFNLPNNGSEMEAGRDHLTSASDMSVGLTFGVGSGLTSVQMTRVSF